MRALEGLAIKKNNFYITLRMLKYLFYFET